MAGILIVVSLLAHFSVKEAFIFAVGVSAAMIPEWLPAQVSIALSLAAGRLAKNRALVKQLSSVETLWCVSVICTDKTGTLTKNEMTVKNIWLGNKKNYEVTGDGYQPVGIVQEPKTGKSISSSDIKQRDHFFSALYLASNAKVNPPDEDHSVRYAIGDPTEAALISLAQKVHIDTETLDIRYHEEHQFGFDSVRKMMSSMRMREGERFLYVKGAPSEIIAHCTQIFDGNNIRPITQKDTLAFQNYVENQSAQAMRNLAFAYKPIEAYQEKMSWQEAEQWLILLGCVSIIDPPREEVAAAIISAHEAKIKIVMITGDYGVTAEAIAKHVGLETAKEAVIMITGNQLKDMTDIDVVQQLEQPWSIIFSRTSPEDKLRIVTLLKKNNYVVAVTGDGINDAPALKKADIWVAMGKIGTDVAKESSEIVLLDDSFHTLVYAIREGRSIFQNLKKTILSCITSNGGELFAVLPWLVCRAIFGLPMAITAVQILAIDLIGEMFPLTALTRDPPQKDVMTQWPRNINEHVINKPMIIDLIWSWLLMWWLWFISYIVYLVSNGHILTAIDTQSLYYAVATTVTYTSVLFCQFANILSRRAGEKSVFTKYLWSNKRLLFAFSISLGCLWLLIYNPWISQYFWFGAMRLVDRMFPVASWIVFLLIREAHKYFKRKR